MPVHSEQTGCDFNLKGIYSFVGGGGLKTRVTKLLQHRVTSAVRRGTRHRRVVKSERSKEEVKVILEGLGMHQGSVAISVSSGTSSVPPTGKMCRHGLDIPMQG